jgi:cell filamentation protein
MDDPYVDPATHVLYNLRGISEAGVLEAAEREAAGLRDVVLKTHRLSGAYDLSHLQGFHRCLFQDIYAWAGEIRTVSIARGKTLFCLPEHLEASAQEIFDRLGVAPGLSRDPAQAAESLAAILGDVNALHPFREGNGRAQRSFVWQYAFENGWDIDWSRLDAPANVAASIEAMACRYGPLAALIEPLLRPAL